MRLRKLSQYLFPCQCYACQKISTELVCQQCQLEMQGVAAACVQCGEQLPHTLDMTNSISSHCGRCLSQAPAFEQTLFAYAYRGHAAKLVQQFKFKQALILADFLAKQMYRQVLAEILPAARPDVLVPIPLHSKRLKQRGFNQSYELAKPLSKMLGSSVSNNILLRSRPTSTQSGLNRKAREKNIKGAFTLNHSSTNDLAQLKDKRIAIVDDVITTGATVREAAKTLSRLNPRAISVFAIAKTQYGVDFR